MRLARKTCIVTAAGAGIGRACALAFAAEGARVIATDIDEAALHSLADAAPGIEVGLLDVRDPAAVVRLAEHEADVLLNVAGIVPSGTILDFEEAQWAAAVDLNVTAMIRTIRAVLPGMLARGNGSIVNMASVASSITGVPNRFVYGATKAAVIGLTKSVAVDFVAQGVRCNAVAPGTIDTPSLQQRLMDGDNYEETRARFLSRQPMGRFGKAEEVAALAIYLAGDESAFTTGQVHVLDGGWTT